MTPISSRLAPVQAYRADITRRWQGSGAQRLWQSWLNELHGCLPKAWRHWLTPEVQVQTHHWPVAEPLPALNVSAYQQLILPADSVMIRNLRLPVAAARDLGAVVGYELDKYTPYPRDQLHYVARQDSRSAGFVQVTVVAIARERLEKMLAACAHAGLVPQCVDAWTKDGTALGVNLLSECRRPAERRTRLGLRHKLTVMWVALSVTLMLLWLQDRQQLLAEMQATVQAQKAQVAQVQQMRQQLTNSLGASDYLARRKAARPTMAALLSELTACLPSDTWIETLEIDDSAQLSFSGQSARASALIGHVKDCRSLENPQFQGVIQPDADSGKDHFSLHAQLHQEATDGPTTDTP